MPKRARQIALTQGKKENTVQASTKKREDTISCAQRREHAVLVDPVQPAAMPSPRLNSTLFESNSHTISVHLPVRNTLLVVSNTDMPYALYNRW
jgi:hypothetical protein